MLQQFKQKLEHKLIIGLFWWVSKLSEKQLFNFGHRLGRFFFRLGMRRKIVSKNLRIAYPEFTEAERLELAIKTYQQVGLVIVEYLKMRHLSTAQVKNSVIIHGKEHLLELMQNKTGGVMVSGHFGNSELGMAALASTFNNIHTYVDNIKNPWINFEVNKTRQQFGVNIILKSYLSFKKMLNVLEDQQLVLISSDQNTPNRRCFIDFFNKKASLGQGFAVLARKKKVPLFFVWILRKKILQHELFIEPLDYPITDDIKQDYQVICQMYSDRLVQIIQQHPEHYFWLNRRWKTRPLDEDQNFY